MDRYMSLDELGERHLTAMSSFEDDDLKVEHLQKKSQATKDLGVETSLGPANAYPVMRDLHNGGYIEKATDMGREGANHDDYFRITDRGQEALETIRENPDEYF